MVSVRHLAARARQFADESGGVVAAITALLIVPLSLGVGVAVDASRMFLVRSQLSQAVDAAALAAGQALDPEQVASDARRIFDLNYPPDGYMGARVGELEVNYDEVTGQIELIARTSMPTAFMQLAHVDSIDLQARALVVRQQTGLELALVLDVTGSMCSPCTKISALKQAAKDLLDIVYGPNDTGEDLYVAVVPFSARVKIGTSRSSWLSEAAPKGWNGCVEQRSGDEAFNDAPLAVEKFPPSRKVTWTDKNGKKQSGTPACPTELLPLTASKATVKSKIDALGTGGTTRIDIGAAWGWRALSERWQGAWGTAGLPLANDEDPAKAIVIMSDGANVVASQYDGTTSKAQADQNVRDVCQAMRDEGYVLFTVAFQAGADAEALLRDCAGSSENFFASPTAEDLRRAFRQIAGRLSALRLAE